eukprot:755281-Hanusia_phi.AAC.3
MNRKLCARWFCAVHFDDHGPSAPDHNPLALKRHSAKVSTRTCALWRMIQAFAVESCQSMSL